MPRWAELVKLRDGSSVTVRRVRAQDEPALRSFLEGLCLEAQRLRFFTGAANLAFAAHLGAAADAEHCGLVAHDETGALVGHATYVKLTETRAEVAVEVADHLHGRGLGTILIERLAAIAEQRGITHFVAEVLGENRAMLDVFREGFDGRVVRNQGSEKTVEFLTAGWRLAHARFEGENEKGRGQMFRKVIVGFDGSDHAQDALRLGQALTDPDGELVVCCVHHFQSLSARIDPTEPRIDEESAQAMVEKATQLLDGSLNVTTKLVAGAGTAIMLQRVATEEQAELIVLGSSHRGTLGRVFIGSVPQETLHQASCPVAVAPVGFHDRQVHNPIKRIAVGHDPVEATPGALSAAVALCQQTGAELLLVAVAEDATVVDPERDTMSYEAITRLRLRATQESAEEMLSSVPQRISASSEVLDGDPAEQLIAASENADLLVLGSHGRGLIDRLIMGSVSDRVVRTATCPVLVIPASADTTDPEQHPSSTIGASHES